MKELHLVCNAHIDPVWMWNWEEGVSAALSTFYSAAELADEFNYIFCHNEVILYEYVEKHAPALFARICDLVEKGKWKIVGGWYLQPDCNMPCGEAFVRQIQLGRQYFWEKFHVKPTTAINYDSFGHSVGLVQILKKTGYDSYIVCRPNMQEKLFVWKGVDGSKVKVACQNEGLYASPMGMAKSEILKKAEEWKSYDHGLALWGVGNHGGGPSRKDLSDIQDLMKESEYVVKHSYPEAFFDGLTPMVTKKKSLLHSCIKTYSSMNSIKQKNIELESGLLRTEKILALANLHGYAGEYENVFRAVERQLACLQFHDIASGTCARDGETSALAKANAATDALNEVFTNAFFYLAEKFEKAKDGEFPIFVFNPHPYVLNTSVDVEFLVPVPLVSDDEMLEVTVRQGEQILTSQIIKEASNIAYDRRKRVLFRCQLPAYNVARFDCVVEKKPLCVQRDESDEDVVLSDCCKTVKISRKTGLLQSYVVNGKEYLAGGAFRPLVLDDTPDTWGFFIKKVGKNAKAMRLSKGETGAFKGLKSVKIVEDGKVLTCVEALFETASSALKIAYKIYKDLPYIDVDVTVLQNEKLKILKLEIPALKADAFVGQIAYGTEAFPRDGSEQCPHRFVAVTDGDTALAVFNDCIYGASCEKKNLRLTLLNGAAYCAHPIFDRPMIDESRFNDYIENGLHRFRFRFAVCQKESLERMATEFTQQPYSLNHFPHGEVAKTALPVKCTVDNASVVLSVLRSRGNGEYVVRLFNNTARVQRTDFCMDGVSRKLKFKKYEVKTLLYQNGVLSEVSEMIV